MTTMTDTASVEADYAAGYAAGLDYGRRGYGVTDGVAASRGDDYLAGYEAGYVAAWKV